MKRTPLKRKTPLKAKTGLKRTTPLKAKQKTAKKLPGKYWSIFTDDLKTCYISGTTYRVHPHHVFGGSRKALSEKYGFILPLTATLHEGTKESIHENRAFDLDMKQQCYKYYLEHIGTKEDWLREFGKIWAA